MLENAAASSLFAAETLAFDDRSAKITAKNSARKTAEKQQETANVNNQSLFKR